MEMGALTHEKARWREVSTRLREIFLEIYDDDDVRFRKVKEPTRDVCARIKIKLKIRQRKESVTRVNNHTAVRLIVILII